MIWHLCNIIILASRDRRIYADVVFFCSFAHLRMAFRKERNLLGVNSLRAAKELVKLIHSESFSSLGVKLKEILYFKNGQFLGDRSSDELIHWSL